METVRINETLSVGTEQPTAEDLRQLARAGYKTVVDLRTVGETDQVMEPDQEAAAARAAGLEYLHIPVSTEFLSDELVDQFREEIDRRSGPILVHCRSGKRSGALSMLHVAAEQHLSGDEVIERAEDMGFECDSESLVEFVKRYADEHSPRHAGA